MEGSRKPSRFRAFVFQRRAELVAILVVAVVTASAVYVAARILEESRERTYDCTYTLVLTPANDDPYTVFVPIPCTWSEGQPDSGFKENISVAGDIVVEVEVTQYGPALRIEGTGRAEVNWSSSSSGDDSGYYPNLTMVVEAEPGSIYKYQAWMSSDHEGVSAYLNYSASTLRYPKPWFASSSDRDYRIVMGSGEAGWRLVGCEFEWEVGN